MPSLLPSNKLNNLQIVVAHHSVSTPPFTKSILQAFSRHRPFSNRGQLIHHTHYLAFTNLRYRFVSTMTTMSPPVSPEPSDAHPRAGTSMSYTSHRSRRSNSSASRPELTEFSKDKKRLNTKADPTQAINEATPGQSMPLNAHKEILTFAGSGTSTRRIDRRGLAERYAQRQRRQCHQYATICLLPPGNLALTLLQPTQIDPILPVIAWNAR